MAEKVVIAATLQVDTGNSNANIKDVNKNLNEVKDNLKSTGAAATSTGKTIDNSTGSFGKLKGQLSSMPGPLGAASDGVKSLGTAFKALLANPVGLVILAIVAALALLYKSFTNTHAGAQKMEQVFAGLKAAGQALFDNLGKLAGAIVKLFKFDFKGAYADMKGVVAAAGDAYNKAAEFTKKIQELEREQSTDDLEKKKRETRLALLREQLNDEKVSLQEKKKIAAELRDDQIINAKDDLERSTKLAEAKIGLLKQGKDGELKNAKEINEILGQIEDTKKENALEGVRTNKVIRNLENQEAAEKKQIHDEQVARIKALTAARKEAEKERLAIIEREIEAARKQAKTDIENAALKIKDQQEQNEKAEADAINARNSKATINPDLLRARDAVLANDLIKQSEQERADFVIAVAQREADARIAITMAVGDALGTLADIAGRQTAIGKGLAIAQATIATYQAAVSSFNSLSSIPIVGPILGAIAAAGAIAMGIANVKKIIAVKAPGVGGGGSAPTPTAMPAAPVAPTQASTKIDPTQFQQIGNAAGPARVYMVESDGANTSERVERLNRAARFG